MQPFRSHGSSRNEKRAADRVPGLDCAKKTRRPTGSSCLGRLRCVGLGFSTVQEATVSGSGRGEAVERADDRNLRSTKGTAQTDATRRIGPSLRQAFSDHPGTSHRERSFPHMPLTWGFPLPVKGSLALFQITLLDYPLRPDAFLR